MRRTIRPFGIACALITAAVAGGCSWQTPRPELDQVFRQPVATDQTSAMPQPAVLPPALPVVKKPSLVRPLASARNPADPDNLWESLAKSLTFSDTSRAEVRREINWYQGQGKFLRETSMRAAPYLHFIASEIERRNLPPDLALLPILESGYVPSIVSPLGAAGLWQFMGGTGNKFGLQRSAWLDERLDVVASTEAALEYLNTLQRRFDGDWLLAIAAYNAGWGNVERAIAHNRRAGQPTDVWSLELTSETHRLIARFLALVEIYRHPAKFNLKLDALPDRAVFSALVLHRPTDLRRLVQLAKIDERTFQTLNPGLKGWHTGPISAQRVLIPVTSFDVATRIASRLGPSLPPTAHAQVAAQSRPATMHAYAAKNGDSLWVIARRFDTRVAELERLNTLNRNHPLRIGQRIIVPAATHHTATATAASLVRYRVRAGDSLWTISRRFKVTIKELQSWNKLAIHATLRLGQELLVRIAS